VSDKVLEGLDASRRAAWAKYYAEKETADRYFKELMDTYEVACFFAVSLRRLFPDSTTPDDAVCTAADRRHMIDFGCSRQVMEVWEEAGWFIAKREADRAASEDAA
jgi:hypothetical protein